MSWKWNKNAVNSLYAPFCSGIVPGETQSSIQNSSRIAATSEHSINADELQQLYLPDVSRYVRRRIENPDEADDITAEVFAAAFAALPRFRHECHPRIWLLRIVHRRILMAARHRKTHRYALRDSHHSAHAEAQGVAPHPSQESVSAAEENPAVLLERAEAQRVLRDLMRSLKTEQCEALRLQYWEGLSVNEIAVVMKRSPAAVNSLLQRARKTIFERGKNYFLKDEVTS